MPLKLRVPSRTTSKQPNRVAKVAHRGASAYAAENTLAAIRRAIALDADHIEVDVQRSKDGALVLTHDTTLTRTTNAAQVFPDRAPWRVGDFTHDELKRLDAGSSKSPDFAGEQIATLSEAIEVVRGSDTGLLAELKVPGLYPGIVSETIATMRHSPGYVDTAVAAGRLVVQSFNVAAMKEYTTHDPTVPVGLLGAPAPANLPALATWASQINPHHRSVDKTYVDQVHRLGMSCMVWTVNREPAIRRALRMGVDGIITNRPDLLAHVLRGHVHTPT